MAEDKVTDSHGQQVHRDDLCTCVHRFDEHSKMGVRACNLCGCTRFTMSGQKDSEVKDIRHKEDPLPNEEDVCVCKHPFICHEELGLTHECEVSVCPCKDFMPTPMRDDVAVASPPRITLDDMNRLAFESYTMGLVSGAITRHLNLEVLQVDTLSSSTIYRGKASGRAFRLTIQEVTQ